MIFYFTGTGNSLWVAQQLAQIFNDRLVGIAHAQLAGEYSYNVAPAETVGFVFPVHSWGVPPIVRNFVDALQLNGYSNNTIYAIFTCGDECGYTKSTFAKLLASRGWSSQHLYSVQMPNTYICFPKFGIDPKELEEKKINVALASTTLIAESIANNSPISHYHKGGASFIKSRMIYPLFMRFALDSSPFRTTAGCISCGACAKKCPVLNITMIEGKPQWGNKCTQCLACIHHCPTRSIEYGKVTVGKERYTRFAKQQESS